MPGEKPFELDSPSRLAAKFLDTRYGEFVYSHAMHSVVDWAAFAVWRGGVLVRSLSLSLDSGIVEDIGEKLDSEKPYWNGQHPAIDPTDDDPEKPYAFVFHPLELGEAALPGLFGFELEGAHGASRFQSEDAPLMGLKRKNRKWWKFW